MTAPKSLALLLMPLLLAGCLQTRSGRPGSVTVQNERLRERKSDDAEPIRWRQIVVGSPPNQKVEGYLKTELIQGMPPETRHQYWIYDRDFQIVGRISPRGMTWRRDAFGREQRLGNFHVKHGVISILGHLDEIEINLVRMPPPA
jgi:hypothetical protein